MKQLTTLFLLFFLSSFTSAFWGFYAHRLINRHAVFSLPQEMIPFYKKNIDYLIVHSVAPDKRRYALKEEAPRHYIDLDEYEGSIDSIPMYWKAAVEKYSEDTLIAYGIVPWHIGLMSYQLTEAFKNHKVERILRLSAELGHYIGDANVPLHTTRNYNGQLTGQHGIHGLWESRLPEIFSKDYDLWIGKAEYINNTQEAIWQAVCDANQAVDSVLRLELQVRQGLSEDLWYGFEERGAMNVKVYSDKYASEYNRLLNSMVERQLRKSIKMVADFWFTCWVDAGQPDLNRMIKGKDRLVAKDSSYHINEKFSHAIREHHDQ